MLPGMIPPGAGVPQDPTVAFLAQLTQNYQPLATGLPFKAHSGLEGIPFLQGSGLIPLVAQLIAAPQIQKLANEYGYVPLGVGHNKNIYDAVQMMRLSKYQREFTREMAKIDEDNFKQTLIGFFNLAGIPIRDEEVKFINQSVKLFTELGPLAADIIGPRAFESLGGRAGFQQILSRNLFNYGRYRIDPVTGLMGITPETINTYTELSKPLFYPDKIDEMRGFTAGEFGEIIGQLQLKGKLPSLTDSERRELTRSQVRNMLATKKPVPHPLNERINLTPDDIDKLDNATLDLLAEKNDFINTSIKKVDLDRIRQQTKKYIDVLATIREIFGEQGLSDVGIPQLIQYLEAFTQGNPDLLNDKTKQVMRNLYNLSKTTGVQFPIYYRMQEHNALLAEKLGVSPLATYVATENSLLAGAGYRTLGFDQARMLGQFNEAGFYQLEGNMTVQAAASNTANRIRTLGRIAALYKDELDPNSDLARAIKTIQENPTATEFVDSQGKTRSLYFESDQAAYSLIASSKTKDGKSLGITEGDFRIFTTQRKENEQFLFNESTQLTRAFQTKEILSGIQASIGRQTTDKLKQKLEESELDIPEDKLGTGVIKPALSRLLAVSYSDFLANNEEGKTRGRQAFANLLKEEIIREKLKELPETATQEEKQKIVEKINKINFLPLANMVLGEADSYFDRTNLPYRGFVNFYLANNKELDNFKTKTKVLVDFQTQMADRFSQLPNARGSVSQIVETLKKASSIQQIDGRLVVDNDFYKSLLEAVGSVGIDKLKELFEAQKKQIEKEIEQIDKDITTAKENKKEIEKTEIPNEEKTEKLKIIDKAIEEKQIIKTTKQKIIDNLISNYLEPIIDPKFKIKLQNKTDTTAVSSPEGTPPTQKSFWQSITEFIKAPPNISITPMPVGGVPTITPMPVGGVPTITPMPVGGVPTITPMPVGGVPTITPMPVSGVPTVTPVIISGTPTITPMPVGGYTLPNTPVGIPNGGFILVPAPAPIVTNAGNIPMVVPPTPSPVEAKFIQPQTGGVAAVTQNLAVYGNQPGSQNVPTTQIVVPTTPQGSYSLPMTIPVATTPTTQPSDSVISVRQPQQPTTPPGVITLNVVVTTKDEKLESKKTFEPIPPIPLIKDEQVPIPPAKEIPTIKAPEIPKDPESSVNIKQKELEKLAPLPEIPKEELKTEPPKIERKDLPEIPPLPLSFAAPVAPFFKEKNIEVFGLDSNSFVPLSYQTMPTPFSVIDLKKPGLPKERTLEILDSITRFHSVPEFKAATEKVQPVEIKGHLTGKLKVEGDAANLISTVGGSRHFITPT